ncbi:MAG: AtpZ/AtpI family protein [Acidimicrobiia bacterium]|nr:AtpZ/AtpI family protein [Acidimicrobiia bacterium]
MTDDEFDVEFSPESNGGFGRELDKDDRARAEALRRTVLRKTIRRERARRRRGESPWTWLGTFGLVGWTVVAPTLLGLAAGIFVDNRIDSPVSFTITFLIVGTASGLTMAWHWVRRESESEDER